MPLLANLPAYYANANQPIIENAYPSYQLDSVRDKARLIAIKGKELNMNPRSPMTFTNLGSGDIYYALYSNGEVRSFNLAMNQYLGGSKLEMYSETTLEPELINAGIQSTYENPTVPGSGCLLEHPLRYSDLDLDGKKELVLLLGGSSTTEWVVFSTELKKVIFSSILVANHAFQPSAETIERIYPEYGKPSDFQYLSDLSNGNPPPMEMGVRSFAKLFFGDFNNDNVFDIVVWRKYFESRVRADAIQGFEKKNELLVHYQIVNGEYKKQPTDQTTAKSWLTTNNQTWKKGYPNTSECANQPNQLISEMHDPLLNDPEVLQ